MSGFFTVDHKAAGGFAPLPNGKYEAIVSQAEVKKSSAGNDMIKVTLTIREDIQQEGQKRKIFDNLVASEAAMFKFQQVAKAIEMEQGAGVGTIQEFAQAIIYKPVKITLKQEADTRSGHEGEFQNRVAMYDVSDVGGGGAPAGGSADPFAGGPPIDISDDDLPF